MEVHFTPEQQAQIAQVATKAGDRPRAVGDECCCPLSRLLRRDNGQQHSSPTARGRSPALVATCAICACCSGVKCTSIALGYEKTLRVARESSHTKSLGRPRFFL